MAKKKIGKNWSLWKKHPSARGAEGHSMNLNKRKGIKSEVRRKKEVWIKKE